MDIENNGYEADALYRYIVYSFVKEKISFVFQLHQFGFVVMQYIIIVLT